MDKSIQQSLVNTVNQIVNKQAECEDCKYYELAEAIETALNAFEDRFCINLNEDQEDSLIEVGIRQLTDRHETPVVDLAEETIEIINNYSPEEVFASILEATASATASLAPTPSIKAGAAKAAKAAKSTTTPSDDQETDDDEEEQQQGGEEAESTTNPFGFSYALHQQALAQVQGDPNRRNVSGYVGGPMNESEVKENPMKKHKKKVFKISFMDKGIKKKGTAVSHKGVMRIVSGKSSFKVYDEKNRDVTSMFKQQTKKDKK
jgi:ribosomal protein L12E/L44/L45/RPP1/RPP2